MQALQIDKYDELKVYLDNIDMQAKEIAEMITSALTLYRFESEKRDSYEEIKFGKPDLAGIINISFNIEDDNLVIRVEDNGIGIPIDQRNRIFEEFFRAENGKTREGTGVGLSSVKSFLESIPGALITFSDSALDGIEFIMEHPLRIEGLKSGFRLKDASITEKA